MVLLTVCW